MSRAAPERSIPRQKRKLGQSDLEVSASFSYGPPEDEQEMTALLRAAVERGASSVR